MTLAALAYHDNPSYPFDPLVDLAGAWTTDLAERYLPIPGMAAVKYECLDGKLIMIPYESSANSYAAIELSAILRIPVKNAGCLICGTTNVAFGPKRWIQPDLTIVRDLPEPDADVWVPSGEVVMPVEFVSPTSRRRDRVDKPALCASVGIPYFMEVEVRRRDSRAEVKVFELRDDRYVELAVAGAGSVFEIDRPFPLSFDPAELLPPRSR